MTDLEMTRLCADAMGYRCMDGQRVVEQRKNGGFVEYFYDPLHDGAQAMALVKKMRLDISSGWESVDARDEWQIIGTGGTAYSKDLNRAIVECCARMQAAKK